MTKEEKTKETGPLKDLFYKITRKEGGEPIKVQIADVLNPSDTWLTPKGMRIISLKGLQKIQKHEDIVTKDFQVVIKPNEGNRKQHGVVVWLGFKGDAEKDNWEYGTGEASELNTGKVVEEGGSRRYEEFTSIDSKYRLAMADKRAFSRALLKLINLHGVYSEVEARDFLEGKPDAEGDIDYDNL